MEINRTTFSELPFGSLFVQLIDGDPKVRKLYAHDPFDFQDRLNKPCATDKNVSSLLRAFNTPFGISAETAFNIDLLADPSTKCVVTGQQLTVFGGPLYTFFKIATTIALAKRLSQESGRKVVPVFWMADEDHDYDEVASISLVKGSEIVTHVLADASFHPLPVAHRQIGTAINDYTNEVFESLGTTDFTPELRRIIEDAYVEDQTHGQAFGILITRIFGKHGLVLAGSNDTGIKALLMPVMVRAVAQSDAILNALEMQSIEVDALAPRQAQVSDSLLFYLNPEQGGARERIRHNAGIWTTGESNHWTTEELTDAIMQHPQYYSPNVFLRPILQDVFLPTVAYVAGPGEMAYYAQMKQLYELFGLEMPVITPRHSATLVEPAIRRLYADLPFEFLDYIHRIDDLEKRYIAEHSSLDPDRLTDDWLTQIAKISESYIESIGNEDPTLRASAEKVVSEFQSSIERVKGKLVRSVKLKEQTALNRIRRVKISLFPDNGLQERSIAGIYFMNKYGLDVWDHIIEAFASVDADNHYTIDV